MFKSFVTRGNNISPTKLQSKTTFASRSSSAPKPAVQFPYDEEDENLRYSSDEDKNIEKLAVKTIMRQQRKRRKEFAEKYGDGT